jgi:hypothetical protein
MKHETMSILFYALKSRTLKNGEAPIQTLIPSPPPDYEHRPESSYSTTHSGGNIFSGFNITPSLGETPDSAPRKKPRKKKKRGQSIS